MHRPAFPLPAAALFASASLLAGCGGGWSSSDASRVANVFGPDDRVEVRSDTYPYASIGRVHSGCTGTVVGRRLVLTAAHCVVRTGSGAVWPMTRFFYANVVDGAPRAEAWIEYIWYGTDRPDGPNSERGKDWALLKLDRDLGESFRPFDVAVADLDQFPFTTELAGYSSDIEGVLTKHAGCSIRERQGERYKHDCDAKAGVSGGPMFAMLDGVATIHAISVSEYRGGAAQSVHADAYSSEFANVAINASAFHDVYRVVRAALDRGEEVPALPHVLQKANPNRPTDPDPTPAPRPGITLAQVVPFQEIVADAHANMGIARLLEESALAMHGLALAVTDATIHSQARDLSEAAVDLGDTILRSLTTIDNDGVRASVAHALTRIETARAALRPRVRECTGSDACAGLRPHMGNVDIAADHFLRVLVRR